MMKATPITAILFLAIVFFSCTKDIDYKGDDKAPQLVVNAIVENDSTFRVHLERSYFFLSDEEPDDKYIESGAVVKVTNLNTGEVFTMTQSSYDNVYNFPFLTGPSTKYKIEVSHPSYPAVDAEMTTAPKVDLLAVDTSSYTTGDGELRKKALLSWNDPSGENYYMLHLFYSDPVGNYTYQMSYICQDEVTSSSGVDPLSDEEPSYMELVFGDELFAGEQKKLEIEFATYKGVTPAEDPVYTYRLITLNKETYQYYLSVHKHMNNDGPFTEPVKVYNNINNGFGIFSSLNTSQVVK